MGSSCGSQKKTEDKEIGDFFNHLYKNKKFEFSISKYDENYDIIINNSQNNFKKGEKKQNVRLGFITEVAKYFIYQSDEKEEQYLYKACFHILILTVTFKYYIEENMDKYEKANDIEQSLLSISSKILSNNFKSGNTSKVLLYYLSKLFALLFKKRKDVCGYFNLPKYITQIQEVAVGVVMSDAEKFAFMKANLISVGVCCTKNNQFPSLTAEQKRFLISIYISTLNSGSHFIMSNYEGIKQYLIDLHSNTFLGNSAIKASTSINDSNEKEKDYVIISNENFISFKELYESGFNFMDGTIIDGIEGKIIWKEGENEFESMYKNKNNTSYHIIIELILLGMFNKCKGKINKKKTFVTSMFEYISDKIIKDVTCKYYRNILGSFCQGIICDEVLRDRCMGLYAQIFIKEILNTNYNNMFIEYIQDINDKSRYKLFFSGIYNIGLNFQDIASANSNDPCLVGIYRKITTICTNYSNIGSLTDNEKNKQRINFLDVKNIIRKFHCNNKERKIDYIRFYISFLFFLKTHFKFSPDSDFTMRKFVYLTNITYIYEGEVMSMKSETFFSEIISLTQLLICFMQSYSQGYFEDSYAIYKLFALTFKQFQHEINWKHQSYSIYLIYLLVIFVGMNIKSVFNLPNNIEKIHDDVVKSIVNINSSISEILGSINGAAMSSNTKSSIEIRTYDSLIALGNNSMKISTVLSTEQVFQILDIFYARIFGNSSSGNSFFDNQMNNKHMIYVVKDIGNDTFGVDGLGSQRKETDGMSESNMAGGVNLDFFNNNGNDGSLHLNIEIPKGIPNKEEGRIYTSGRMIIGNYEDEKKVNLVTTERDKYFDCNICDNIKL